MDSNKNWIKRTQKNDKITLMGSGGNINKLFKLSNTKEGKPLSKIKLNQLYKDLLSLSYEERIISYGLNTDRADVIVPAAKFILKLWSGVEVKKYMFLGLGSQTE